MKLDEHHTSTALPSHEARVDGLKVSSAPHREPVSALLATLVACAIGAPFCFDPLRETDAGWHLAIGRLIATDGIPKTNALSWVAGDTPWYATSWLYDLIAYQAVSAWGVPGLQLFTFFLFALAMAALVVACREADPFLGPWMVPATALLLIPRISERPHMASFAALAVVLALGAVGRTRGWRWRAAAIPVIAFASNFHSGAMFATLALGAFCLEASFKSKSFGREALLTTLGFGALLANPGGLFNVLYVVEHLGVQSVVRLAEFETPTLRRAPTFYAALALAVLAGLFHLRKRPADLLLAIGFGALGIFALRLVYKFEIVAALVLAGSLPALRARLGLRSTAAIVAVTLATLTWARERYLGSVEIGGTWNTMQLPVRAAEFVKAIGLKGKPYNGFSDGGYLEWALPEVRWFQDGRVQAHPPELFATQLAASKSPEAFDAWLRGQGVEWAVVSRSRGPLSGRDLFEDRKWALVYWDEGHEVRLRRDLKPFEALIARLEYRWVRPGVDLPEAIAGLDADGLEATARELDLFEIGAPGHPLVLIGRCAVESRRGTSAAKAVCDEASSTVPAAFEHEAERAAQVTALER